MEQEARHPESRTAAGNNQPRRAQLRRACYLLLAAGVGIVSYLVLKPEAREIPLEAGNRAPYTQPMPQPEPVLELPPPALVPSEPLIPDMPPADSVPDEAAAGEPPAQPAPLPKDSPSYLGPRAPEYTGSPAPAGAGLVDGVLFGHPVLGLHPELLRRLQRVSAASTTGAASTPANALGVEMIVGYRQGSRAHSRGLAVDVNYYANPYIMHESGEAARDLKLAPVYDRISRLILGRHSVIPNEITQGTPDRARTLRLYRALQDESRAMIAYFRLMQDRESLRHFLATHSPQPAEAPELLQQQMAADYVTLSGRAGPPIPGVAYPAPETTDGDPPFSGDPVYRGPELGFLNLREDLVRALTDAGLRWGGTDMGANSGDLMHFYLPDPGTGTPR